MTERGEANLQATVNYRLEPKTDSTYEQLS